MGRAPARFYRGQSCCDGTAPYWSAIYDSFAYGGPLSNDEAAAARAIEEYGGTLHAGSSATLAPMEHTNLVDWNRAIMMPATANSYQAPYDRNLPRIQSAADLPSLPNPDVGPSNGLPHHQATLDYQERERAKLVTSLRAVYDEATGQYHAQILWCLRCGPDIWEQFVSDLGQTFTEMVPVLRGIGMVVSYIPIIGTAISFALNASISLAQGQTVDEAFLDGVGAALPGQPMSGEAFNAVRAIAKGDPIDKIAIAALPLDKSTKDLISTASDVIQAIVNGESITRIALDELYANLPDAGKKAMDIAKRIVNGENIPGIVVSETERAVINAAVAGGESSVNKYISEAGYQAALGTIDPSLRDAITVGLMAGAMEKHANQFVGTFNFSDKAPATNDAYAAKGRQIVASGAKYNNVKLSDILQGAKFTIVVNMFNAVEGHPEMRAVTYEIDDLWRRGFEVAIGLCDGMSEDGPGQQGVKVSLGNIHAQNGFDAGQAVQHHRTLGGNLGLDRLATPVESASNSAFLAALTPPVTEPQGVALIEHITAPQFTTGGAQSHHKK